MGKVEITKELAIDGCVALLATIVQMSDEAQKNGGATSISGVASLHRMQTSIQKNRARMVDLMQRATS